MINYNIGKLRSFQYNINSLTLISGWQPLRAAALPVISRS